ncbi:MAG: hypothetical protein AUJ92_13300 [Armatimonadetes bacterium CG2_30_59_28]|nr:type II toxin-antitoxin system HicA family toxin [Armatimonadota bacterium]OIO92896.1 MAG: hypothetical protein AUJ92_13300 [Armatimonadetes bacterium CG2_30_59_28]PIU62476.1 MAG: type II toxin-antitoxin system HicA family toxin [Armatimonadetes bacterium CG07_land_8_20_14_0_80_59_28]PJB68629.1 MAG: type II toxin-antitoxin system HicA family toxin [Armatimonadetes bacterium CG_4_9_14_3_um_filter_58_7]
MPKISPVSWHELMRRLRVAGFEGPRGRGKHPIMRKGDLTVRIPNPHRTDIGPDLILKIIRQAKITRRQWEEL